MAEYGFIYLSGMIFYLVVTLFLDRAYLFLDGREKIEKVTNAYPLRTQKNLFGLILLSAFLWPIVLPALLLALLIMALLCIFLGLK